MQRLFTRHSHLDSFFFFRRQGLDMQRMHVMDSHAFNRFIARPHKSRFTFRTNRLPTPRSLDAAGHSRVTIGVSRRRTNERPTCCQVMYDFREKEYEEMRELKASSRYVWVFLNG